MRKRWVVILLAVLAFALTVLVTRYLTYVAAAGEVSSQFRQADAECVDVEASATAYLNLRTGRVHCLGLIDPAPRQSLGYRKQGML